MQVKKVSMADAKLNARIWEHFKRDIDKDMQYILMGEKMTDEFKKRFTFLNRFISFCIMDDYMTTRIATLTMTAFFNTMKNEEELKAWTNIALDNVAGLKKTLEEGGLGGFANANDILHYSDCFGVLVWSTRHGLTDQQFKEISNRLTDLLSCYSIMRSRKDRSPLKKLFNLFKK